MKPKSKVAPPPQSIQRETQYLKQRNVPRGTFDPKSCSQPVYGTLPDPVAYSSRGLPIYRDEDIAACSSSILLTYPFSIPMTPPDTNHNINAQTSHSMTPPAYPYNNSHQYYYFDSRYAATNHSLTTDPDSTPRDDGVCSSVPPQRRDIAAVDQRARSAPPPSPDRLATIVEEKEDGDPADEVVAVSCKSTSSQKAEMDADDLGQRNASRAEDKHIADIVDTAGLDDSEEDEQCNEDTNSTTQLVADEDDSKQSADGSSNTAYNETTMNHSAVTRAQQNPTLSTFPSPNASPSTSPQTQRNYASVARIVTGRQQNAEPAKPSKPPMKSPCFPSTASSSKSKMPSRPPLLTVPINSRYHYVPPRIQAHRPSKKDINDSGNHNTHESNPHRRNRARVHQKRGTMTAASKRRHRRSELLRIDEMLWDRAHRLPSRPLPIISSSWSESTSPNDTHESTSLRAKRKKHKRKAATSTNDTHSKSKSAANSLSARIERTHKRLKQQTIDQYLKTVDSKKTRSCLLCKKQKYLPTHIIDCPQCGESLLTDSSSDCESSSSQEFNSDDARYMKSLFASKTQSERNNGTNDNKEKALESGPRLAIHPDIRQSNRMWRKFGVKPTSPAHCSLDQNVSTRATDHSDTKCASETHTATISHKTDTDSNSIADNNNNNNSRQSTHDEDDAHSSISSLTQQPDSVSIHRRRSNMLRLLDCDCEEYPDVATMVKVIHKVYEKDFTVDTIEQLSIDAKKQLFDIVKWHLRNAADQDDASQTKQRKLSDTDYLRCLDRYKFKPRIHSPSRVKQGEASMSDMDEDTVSDSDDVLEQKQRDEVSPSTPPRAQRSLIRPTMPPISPVINDNNEIIHFDLPPPLPVVAEPSTLSASNVDLLNEWQWEQKIRKVGIFGSNKINKTDLNTFCVTLLFAMAPGDVSIKCFYKCRQTERSKMIHCIFDHAPSVRGKCRFCAQKKTHHGCRIGSCRATWNAYAAKPDDDQLWSKVTSNQGNNAVLLAHCLTAHKDIMHEIRRRVLAYCKLKPQYVYTVISGVHKYAALQRREARIKEFENIDQTIDAENESLVDVLALAARGKHPPENEAAQIHKTITSSWSTSVTLKLHPPKGGKFYSRCPRGVVYNESCCLKRDGTAGRRQPLFMADRLRFVHVENMKCSRHNYNKIACTLKELQVVKPDRYNISLFRNGNGLMTPQFLLTIVKKYRTVGHRVSKLREYLVEEYANNFWRKAGRHFSLPTVVQVMASFVPSNVTLNKYLRSGQALIYNHCLNNQLTAYMRTSVYMVGFDQTFKRTSRMRGNGATSAEVGLATGVSSQGILLKLGLLNNRSECHDQWARFLGELKSDCLRYGNLAWLKHCGFYWGSDNYKNTQNLPPLINDFIDDQLANNPNYASLQEKLDKAGCTVHDFQDKIVECGLHKFMRDYKCLKEIGVTAANHRDFHLYTHEHIAMLNQLQNGVDLMEPLIQSDWINVSGTTTDDGYIRAIAWYHHYREALEVNQMDKQIFSTINRILKLEAISDFAEKHTEISSIKESAEYLGSLEAMQDLTHKVHPAQRRWILGRWVNAANRVDTDWARKIEQFLDGEGIQQTVYVAATTQMITDIVNRFYMANPLEYTNHLVLYPLHRWITLQYWQLRDSVKIKRCEHEDSDKKPLWDYEALQKQWALASAPKSITAMIVSRNAEYANVWMNVLNESTHQKLGEIFDTIRPSQSAECVAMDLIVQQYHLNDTKIDRILQREPNAFDATFKAEIKAIREEVASPAVFKQVSGQGVIMDISHIYKDLVEKAAEALEIRSIHTTHSRVMRRKERQILGAEITVLKPEKITTDLVLHLHAKYKKSVVVIIRELSRYGIPSDLCIKSGQPITSNPGKIYEAIKTREFDPVHFLPAIDLNTATDNNNTASLPDVPSQYTDTSTTQAMIALHSNLCKAVRFLNENIPALCLDEQKVHAMDLQTYDLNEYAFAIINARKRPKLWGSVMNTQQQQTVAQWASDMDNVKRFMTSLSIEYTEPSLLQSSYALAHATQPTHSMTAITLKYGGDATTNYKYDKKRTSSRAGMDQNARKKRRRTVAWKQIFKFNKKSVSYRDHITVKCSCNLDALKEYHEIDAKYGPWMSLDDALKEMKKISLYSINEGGSARVRQYAISHGWKQNEKHGSSIGFVRDWLVAHLYLDVDIVDMEQEEIHDLFVKNKLIEKSKRGRKK